MRQSLEAGIAQRLSDEAETSQEAAHLAAETAERESVRQEALSARAAQQQVLLQTVATRIRAELSEFARLLKEKRIPQTVTLTVYGTRGYREYVRLNGLF